MEGANILVVDDDKEIANALDKLLTMEGFKVMKAYNGLEALDALVQHDIQLILLDVMMPKLDGLSTTLKIREEKIYQLLSYQQSQRTVIKYWGYLWEQMII